MVAARFPVEVGEVTGWLEREPDLRIGLKSRRQNVLMNITTAHSIEKEELQRIRNFNLGRLTIDYC